MGLRYPNVLKSGQHGLTGYFITGDFNFHFDDLCDASICQFTGQLDTHGIGQHLTGATHVCDHMVDVDITNGINFIILGFLIIVYLCLCDAKGNQSGGYIATEVILDCLKPWNCRKEITFHRLQDVSQPNFIKDIQSSVMPFLLQMT